MASKRMFNNDIVGSDAFLEMPQTSQNLYFHLGMRGDDDGFVNPSVTMRMIGANKNDLDVLISKRFILQFQNGVVVVKHHRINNNWDTRDCKRTLYTEELKLLFIKENNSYTFDPEQGVPVEQKYLANKGNSSKKEIPDGNPTETRRQNRIEENRIDKNNIEQDVAIAPKEIDWQSTEWAEEKVNQLFEGTNGTIDKKYLHLEIIKFKNYWTEKNPGGKKERWQMQKVFDPSRRLGTWFRNFLERSSQRKTTQENKYQVGEV